MMRLILKVKFCKLMYVSVGFFLLGLFMQIAFYKFNPQRVLVIDWVYFWLVFSGLSAVTVINCWIFGLFEPNIKLGLRLFRGCFVAITLIPIWAKFFLSFFSYDGRCDKGVFESGFRSCSLVDYLTGGGIVGRIIITVWFGGTMILFLGVRAYANLTLAWARKQRESQ